MHVVISSLKTAEIQNFTRRTLIHRVKEVKTNLTVQTADVAELHILFRRSCQFKVHYGKDTNTCVIFATAHWEKYCLRFI